MKKKRPPRRIVLTAKHWVIIVLLLVASGIGGALAGLRQRVLARATKPSSEPTAAQRVPTKMEIAESVYDRSFGDGWADWGWGPHQYPQGGTIRVDTSNFGGIIFHHDVLQENFGGVLFRYLAPPAWGDFLLVSVELGQRGPELPDVIVERRHVVDVGGGWREVFIGWGELNPQNSPIDRVVVASRLSSAAGWMTLDKIALTKPSAGPASSAPRRDVKLSIACGETARPISPWIYGISHGAFTSGGTIQRIGGNPMSRLNWDLGGVWNTGSDWFFENVRGEGDVAAWIQGGLKHGVPAAMTVPIIGWVAKDETSSGFPRAKFGAQRKHDEQRPEAGDGFRLDGGAIAPGPPTETSVEAPPELVGRWVAKLRKSDGDRGRGVVMYFLDNEPALWNETHRDVHPEPVSYDELLDRTLRYGKAIRQADPDALVAGPAEWGWTNYFTSAKDREAKAGLTGPDRRAHGDQPLIPWYLERLAEHERTTGVRILDVLDVHFYPAATDVYGSKARTDPEGVALRLRSTRALWDPSYRDESWIGEPVRLIPRLKEWVANNYPGRKISLGEWSFGADEHISGALATAEALGRFGQEGLDAAFYWGGPKEKTGSYWAFRAFRNFDGKGGRFLDQSLNTSEVPGVSLFASRDPEGKKVVAVLLNLDPDSDVRVDLNLDSCGAIKARRTFRYAGSPNGLEEEKPDGKTNQATLTPYSLEVLELALD